MYARIDLKRRVSMRDIAQQTGLSVSAVSLILNNKPKALGFSEIARARVRETAEKLGYCPHVAARRLRSSEQEPLCIGLAGTPTPRGLFLNALFAAAQTYAEQTSIPIQVVFEPYRAGQLHTLPGLMDGLRFNGLIIANSSPADELYLATHEIAVPAILFLRHIPTCHYIDATNYDSGRTAAELLLREGRRRLYILCQHDIIQADEEKRRGFAQVLQEADLPILVTRASSDVLGGCQAMAAVLDSGSPCDGVFAVSDALAFGAMHALRQAGQHIPDDVAIVGHGDLEMARFTAPPLTTFRMLLTQMAQDAVSTLVGIISGKINALVQHTYPSELVLREST
jgi:LacI family transcriptional regulator